MSDSRFRMVFPRHGSGLLSKGCGFKALNQECEKASKAHPAGAPGSWRKGLDQDALHPVLLAKKCFPKPWTAPHCRRLCRMDAVVIMQKCHWSFICARPSEQRQAPRKHPELLVARPEISCCMPC